MIIDRSDIKQLVSKLAVLSGRYQPFSESERECVPVEAIPFVGDIPKSAANEYHQYRLEFKLPRPPQEEVCDLLYTPRGMSWLKGTLYERFSVGCPSVKDLLIQPLANFAASIPQGTVVQVATPSTYGDWVDEYLVCLTRALPIRFPLLVPKFLMDKPYVRRDLAMLGVETMVVEQPVLVREAVVLRKTRPNHDWTVSEVEAYKRAFRIHPIQPRPGSILYISREGERCEARGNQPNRSYPSELTAKIMKELGAKVVLARQTTYEEYCALASEVETVVAEHGAAMCNLLLWKTKNVIELVSDQWWCNSFLLLTKAMGSSNYAIINVDNIDGSELRQKLTHHLKYFNQIATDVE